MQFQVVRPVKSITELHPELALHLCKYLSATDLVSICTAIPKWVWILFRRSPHSYTNKWKWIDKSVCTQLYPELSNPSSTPLGEAIERHFHRTQFDLQFPLFRAPRGTYERVTCLLTTSFLAELAPMTIGAIPLLSLLPTAHTLQVQVNATGRTELRLQVALYQPPSFVGFLGLGSFMLGVSNIEAIRSQISQGLIHSKIDCVVYVIELSMLPRDKVNVRAELRAIVRCLMPKHTFVIVMVDNVRWSERCGMVRLMRYVETLGFGLNSPLMIAPTNWRIWHVGGKDLRVTNRSEIFAWICQDVIWRRMHESVA